MGWFWAETAPSAPIAPHRMPRGSVEPPPGCPMHEKSTPPPSRLPENASTPQGACPYVPPDTPSPAYTSATALQSPPKQGLLSRLNPLNNMPFELPNSRSSAQSQDLPVSRETSTIPKGDGSLWEYPSPQQMYNAMLRKGYTDTPAEHVESMVLVHNFLNEGAWAEIIGWEQRFSRGIVQGYKICARGEENAAQDLGQEDILDTRWRDREVPPPKLLRFTGRPGDMTPKSQILQWLGWVWPSKFATSPPFDRHDWFIQRCGPEGCHEVRYVIDYYEGDPEPTGEPVFYLDVRPAVDSPRGAAERLVRWGTDVWWKASGGVVREVKRMEAEKKAKEEGGKSRWSS
ncbi:cytochrome c heme lyase-like protein [Lindgomyces ingoldianus]|uniref:Cytochrome c heme lyase-like protein n=1 Tax=Lindgomyces ingoldianus TaxID=673940 RepID=A0ACB6R5C0_9PLEO|nr:cytochrome c heme lyase-like protein [Lindgomyces ingoldianus]KAF2473510.1 cytochrome c heme lyase-like protein [Lindgomyces ingoldianus]